jgi:L-alanine-DL-glutamate epimerase-like enolase superfamily enzyme
MDSDEEYVADVIAAKQRGFGAYKVHSKRISTFELAREVAGPDMTLFADPAADWTLEHAIRVGRALEDLDYRWFEEPFRDWNFTKYRKLTRALDIPVAATEALAGGPCGVAQAIVAGEIDIVRADPGWKMGITGTLKVAHLAEAFGLNCELHSGMNGVTDIVNIHLGCAIANTEWFELHVPDEILKFPMLNEYPIQDGVASPPSGPGLGIEIDWDSVDNDSSWFIEATA